MDNVIQNIEAEEAILGGILLDAEAISRVKDILREEAFSLPSHRFIYRACLDLSSQGKQTDVLTVRSWLADKGLLDSIGSYTKLMNLVESVVSAVNIDQYCLLVEEKYRRRMLLKTSEEIALLAKETSIELAEVLEKAEEKIFGITQSNVKSGLLPVGDTLAETWKELEAKSQGLIMPGLPCNYYDLDAMTGGFQRSDLIIIAGRPSMGKTAISTSIAYNIAAIHKLPVAIFSLEMSKEQLVQRMLAGEANIESTRLKMGQIAPHEWESISRAMGTISSLPLFLDDTANRTASEMRSQCRRIQAENGGKLGLVMVDYLQLMEGGGSENRVQELSKITRSLKGLARELNVPVIVLSQLSRGVEIRQDKRPMMSDLRDSGAIEADADLVIMLYRDEYYHPDTPDRGIAEIIVAKHRNGPTGTVKMLFDPQFTRFRNLAR